MIRSILKAVIVGWVTNKLLNRGNRGKGRGERRA